MKLSDISKFVLLAVKAWVKVAADALGFGRGASLPFADAVVIQPDTLSGLINSHALAPVAGPVTIRSVRQRDIPSISSNCNNLVVDLTEAGNPVLPSSVFIKLPLPSLLTRWFFSIIGSWQLESYFFSKVAPDVPLRTPLTFATAAVGSRFFLIQENLHEDPGVRLFTNLDMLAGPSLEQTRKCLDAFARLHAQHFDLDESQRDAILPMDHHPFVSPQMRLVSQALNALALKPCMKKLPGRIPADVVHVYKGTLKHWDALLTYWFSGALSLLHGDSHLGNFFVSGDEMGMLDWQAVHWGKGIRDVQYFLIDSMPADVLAEHERALVDYYVDRRGFYGTAIDPEQTWDEYRSFTYHTLITIVVSIGFGALNEEQDQLMEEILKRSVAAVQRVDYAGWLDNFLTSH